MRPRISLTKLLPVLPAVLRDGLEALGLPTDAPTVRKAAPAPKPEAIDEANRSVIRYVSTRDIDRDSEILVPDGAMLEQFRLAPQVLWGHNYSEPPIGSDEWIKADDYGLKAKTVYAETGRAEEVWSLVKAGHLRTSSVGFVPVEFVEKDGAGWTEIVGRLADKWAVNAKKHFADVKRIYTKWLLLEHSDVSVPANPYALTLAVAKGLGLSEGMMGELGIMTEEDEGESIPIAEAKPYENEHACRLRDPGDFQPDSFRRTEREHEGKKYSIVMGRLRGETTMTEQAYRYGKDVWTAGSARVHCKSHDGIEFEPAKGEGARALRHVRPIRRIVIPRFMASEPDLASLVREEFDKLRGKV